MLPASPSELLDAAGVPAFLVSDLINVRYLSGVEVSWGYVLVTPRRMTLVTDARYREMAQRTARSGVEVRGPDALTRMLLRIDRCGCESHSCTLAQFAAWKRKFKNTKFVQKKDIIQEFRRSKDEQELRRFRRAQRMTAEIVRRVPAQLRQGVTERELAWRLRSWAMELGADDLAFPPIVAFGTHSSRPHHSPTTRALVKGMVVQIDVGARYRGYCADQSEVFFTAAPTREQQRVYDLLVEAHDRTVSMVRPGVGTHVLDAAARSVLRAGGVEEAFTHALGHGVGLEIHEGVSLSSRQPERTLLHNEIITIEPGVYFPGKWGMRVESEVVVR